VNDAAKMLEDRVEAAVNLRSMIPQVVFARELSFVGRFEQIETDFRQVAQRVGAPADLPRMNVSGTEGPYARLFSSHTIDILSAYYADDVREFGYGQPRS
jgi:hypothetical protein